MAASDDKSAKKPDSKGSSDIWNNTMKMVSANFAPFVIMIILFVVASAIIFLVFGAIEGQIVGRFFFGVDYTALAIVTAIQAALIAFVYLWFIGAFYRLADEFKAKSTNINYVNLVSQGLHDALAHPNTLLAMAALAFVGGLIGTFLGGFGYLAIFIESIFIAGAIGIGLAAFVAQKTQWYNFWDLFAQVNKESSNAGIMLYLTLLVELVPVLNIIEVAMIPFSVMLLSQKK
ncbi:MAG: hypothetical protein LVQ95_02500 [Candidatus Micrarchaeales archaeon]|nr:hypothetical protein [Candidatus Micrarchaeales archaeon]